MGQPTSWPFSGFMGECVKMEQIEMGWAIGWGAGKSTLEPGFLPLAIMPRPEIGRRFQEKEVRLWRKTHFIFFMDIPKASLSLIYSVKCLAVFCISVNHLCSSNLNTNVTDVLFMSLICLIPRHIAAFGYLASSCSLGPEAVFVVAFHCLLTDIPSFHLFLLLMS